MEGFPKLQLQHMDALLTMTVPHLVFSITKSGNAVRPDLITYDIVGDDQIDQAIKIVQQTPK